MVVRSINIRYRWVEMIVMFFFLPIGVFGVIQNLSIWLMPILGMVGLICLSLLLVDRQFKRIRLWRTAGIASHLFAGLKLFLPWACILSLLIYLLFPQLFLALPIEDTNFWLLTLLIYPLVSVLPQEIIFRTFFFHRYKPILPSKTTRWILSTFFFGFAHLVYGNWVAVALSWIAGAVFGYRYMQSRSTIAVVIEHSLWGSFLFTVGLGSFFLI